MDEQMLLKYNGWKPFEKKLDSIALGKMRPAVIVLAGRHELSEPALRIIRRKIRFGGKARRLHEHFKPGQAIFVELPRIYTPAGYYEGLYKFAKRISENFGRSIFLSRHRGLVVKDSRHSAYSVEEQCFYANRLREFIEMHERGKPYALSFRLYLQGKARAAPEMDLERLLEIHGSVFGLKWQPEHDDEILHKLRRRFPKAVFVNVHAGEKRPKIVVHKSVRRAAEPLARNLGDKIDLINDYKNETMPGEVLVEFQYPTLKLPRRPADPVLRRARIGGQLGLQLPVQTQLTRSYLSVFERVHARRQIPKDARLLHKIVSHFANDVKKD